MKEKAKVYTAKGTIITEFPDKKGYVAFVNQPFILEIKGPLKWINLSHPLLQDEPYPEMIPGNYGFFYRKGEDYFLPLVTENKLESSPKKGFSFYGHVEYEDIATISDMMKMEDRDKLNQNGIIKHKGDYHSHPIETINCIKNYEMLEQICESQEIQDSEKYNLMISQPIIKMIMNSNKNLN